MLGSKQHTGQQCTSLQDACLGRNCQLAAAGDSACSIPPQTIPKECLDTIREWTPKLARELGVVGLINVQYCVQDNQASVACTDKACLGCLT